MEIALVNNFCSGSYSPVIEGGNLVQRFIFKASVAEGKTNYRVKSTDIPAKFGRME